MYPPNIAKRNCQASSSSLSKYTPIALIACCQSEQFLWKNCIPNYIAMSHNHNDSELGANLATLVCNFSRSKALQFVRKLILLTLFWNICQWKYFRKVYVINWRLKISYFAKSAQRSDNFEAINLECDEFFFFLIRFQF